MSLEYNKELNGCTNKGTIEIGHTGRNEELFRVLGPVRRQLPLEGRRLQVLLPLDEVPDESAAAFEGHEAVEVEVRQDPLRDVVKTFVAASCLNFSFGVAFGLLEPN